MRLLMITRKVDQNEHLAGFIYNWVKKIGEQVDELIVISWQEGDSSGLPDNIKVHHLPTKANKIFKVLKFKKLVLANISKVDGVFCHQMPIYTILAAPIARLWGKKIISWYAHGAVNLGVKLMEKSTNEVITSSDKGFRMNSQKKVILQQGIDTDLFSPVADKLNDGVTRLITVGRISPTKDYDSMIKAVDILVDGGMTNIKLLIIGGAGLGDQRIYFENLKQMAGVMKIADKIEFLGEVKNTDIPKYLQQSDIFLNMSQTGSLDKAILEAMACECIPLTANEAYRDILPSRLITSANQPRMLADKIKWLMSVPEQDKQKIKSDLRLQVIANHNLDKLVIRIVNQFKI